MSGQYAVATRRALMITGDATERRAKVHTAGGRSATQQPKHWIQSSLILEKEESGFFFGCFSFEAFLTTDRENKVAAGVLSEQKANEKTICEMAIPLGEKKAK